jgi:2'-5' RNA ligase
MAPASPKENPDNFRTFICIELPDRIRLAIAALQSQLKPDRSQISWVKPSNIHLTLKFLGNVPVRRVTDVIHAVTRAATVVAPFEIIVGGTGCFPTAHNPRVLWVGLAVLPEPLTRLYDAIESELAAHGYARESRKFSPHLTIARIREPRGGRELTGELIARGFENQAFDAHEVIVMRSEPKPTGAVYTPLAAAPLRSEIPSGRQKISDES